MQFGRLGKERQRFQLFNSSFSGESDLLFRDATDKLTVLQDDIDVSQVMGLDYVALLKGLGHEGASDQSMLFKGEQNLAVIANLIEFAVCVCRKLPAGQRCALVLHQQCRAEEMRAVGSKHKVRPAGVCQSCVDAGLHRENQGGSSKSHVTFLWDTKLNRRLMCLSQKDEVDAVSLDATHTFIAGKCGLVPVVTEYYGKIGMMHQLCQIH